MPRPDHSRFTPASCWPTRWQHMLLRAVAGPEQDRGAAWDELLAACDLETLDSASHALIPLVWTTVVQFRSDADARQRIKGAWRQQWVRHATLRRSLREVLPQLVAGGVEAALVESAASAFLDAPTGVLRPWAELTLAVREKSIEAAGGILREGGWIEESSVAGSRRLSREGAPSIELRSPIFPECAPDRVFWSRMEPATADGMTVLALPRGDRLIHLAYAGIRWAPATPLLSFVDAAWIVGRMSPEECRALVETTREWRMTAAVTRLVASLRDLGVDGAQLLLQEFAGQRGSIGERVESALRSPRPNRFTGRALEWFRARRVGRGVRAPNSEL